MNWRVYLAIGGLASAAAGLGYWSLCAETAARRGAVWAEQQTEAATQAALRKPVNLHKEVTTLRGFARQISAAAGVEVVLDEQRLNEIAIWSPLHNEQGDIAAGDTPLHLPRATLPADAALTMVLRHMNLDYVVRGQQIVITTPDQRDGPLSVAVYPLPQPDPADKTGDARAWAEAVTSLIERGSWDSAGGLGHCEAVPGALVVAQSPRVHERVRALLEGLGRLQSPPASWQPVPLSPSGPAWQKSLASLSRPARIDCRKMPLVDLVEYLAEEYQIPLVLKVQRLSEGGIDYRTPITRKLSGVTLQELLQSVAGELELACLVNEGAIEITTLGDFQQRRWLVAFPVHDLVRDDFERAALQQLIAAPSARRRTKMSPVGCDFGPLIDLITATISPNAWDTVRGPGVCGPVVGGWLIVAQTGDVLAQVEQLLAQLRKGLYQTDTPCVLAAPPAIERIAAALELELPLEYERTTLGDMCQELSQRLRIRVELDYRRLAEQQINITAPVTFRYEPAPLRLNLQRLCQALGMAVAIREGTLLLTTPDAAEDDRCLRVYDVRALVDPDLGLGGPNWLIDLVTGHIEPQSWDSVGGQGSLCFFRGLLVVSQSGEFQRETAGLLAALHQAAGAFRTPPLGGECISANLDATEEAILARLEQPVTIDFDNCRLADALARVAAAAKVPLWIDGKGLKEQGAWTERGAWADDSVTLHARSLPLAAALDRILPREIGYLIEHRELLISTGDRRDEQRRTRLFDVRVLAGLGGDDWLQDLLTAHVQPRSWEHRGGNGSLTCRRGLVVVTQTPDILREVEALLNVVGTGAPAERVGVPSSAVEASIASDGTPTHAVRAPVPATPNNEFAFQSFTGLVQLELLETPLDEGLAQLSRIAGVRIWQDPRGLADVGVPMDRPVTLTAAGSTLAGALDRLLPEELGYFLQGGELVVTSADLAQEQLVTRLYYVGRAAADIVGDITDRGAIEGLPGSYWSEYGGRGEISALAGERLLVTADIARHGQIDDWLTARQTGKPPLRAVERQALEKDRAALDPFAEPPMPYSP